MDRRNFLAGLCGVAGAAAIVSVMKPVEAAAMPGKGILDAIDDPVANDLEIEPSEDGVVEQIRHRRWHRRRYGGRRRHSWRRVCSRYWRHGRWRRRCFRRRVWIGFY